MKIIKVIGCWGHNFRCPFASGWDWGDGCPHPYGHSRTPIIGYETLFCAYNRMTWPNGKGHGKGEMKHYDDIVKDRIIGHFDRHKVEHPKEKDREIINIPGWCPLEDE